MNNLLIIITFLVCLNISAQEFKFKDVSIEEIKEKYHPKDSTAAAATLWEEGKLRMRYDDGFVYDLEVTKRLKIYNKEGFDYATITIPYYEGESNASRERISKLKAFVYNLEGDKIEEEKLGNKDYIDEKVSEYWSQIKFTFPNLRPGTVIEYTYIHTSPHYSELPRWNFQDEIPVNYSKYDLIIPKMLAYKEQQRGFHPVQRNTEEKKFKFYFSEDNSVYQSKSGKGTTLSIFYEYIATDVPKLKDEPFVNNLQNFITSIKLELAFAKVGSSPLRQYSTTWPEISKSLQESKNFGQQLDDTKYFEEDLGPIIQRSDNDETLMLNILDFVKNNIKWDDYTGIYASDRLKKVYKEKSGNIADINLMLTSMLRYAGLEANPVLISTIKHGIPSNFVAKKDYNYIITSVELNDENVLLDASSLYSAPNILPTRCINWFGHIIKPDGTAEKVSLLPKEKSKDNFILNLKLNEDSSIEGQMSRQYTSHLAYLYRVRYTEVDKEKYIESKESDYDINILEYDNKNIENLSEKVFETMRFKKEGAADIINENIYFSPMLFLATKENPFKQDQKERKLPIDFTFPRSNRYIINLEIPKGYTVDYLPEPTAVSLPEKKAFFRYNIQKANNGMIQIMVSEEINEAILPAEFYLPLKDYFSQIVSKETDKIVLKKL